MRKTIQSCHICRAMVSILDIGRVKGSGSGNDALLMIGDISNVPDRRNVNNTPTWYNWDLRTLLRVSTEITCRSERPPTYEHPQYVPQREVSILYFLQHRVVTARKGRAYYDEQHKDCVSSARTPWKSKIGGTTHLARIF